MILMNADDCNNGGKSLDESTTNGKEFLYWSVKLHTELCHPKFHHRGSNGNEEQGGQKQGM